MYKPKIKIILPDETKAELLERKGRIKRCDEYFYVKNSVKVKQMKNPLKFLVTIT